MPELEVTATGTFLVEGDTAVVLVDDEDLEQAARFRWFLRDLYAVRFSRISEGEPRRLITLSRWLLGLDRGDGRVVHHVNRNPLDNRRANLAVYANHGEHMRTAHRGRRAA